MLSNPTFCHNLPSPVVTVSLFPRDFNPRKIHFWQFLWPQCFSALSRAHEFGIKILPIQKPIILE